MQYLIIIVLLLAAAPAAADSLGVQRYRTPFEDIYVGSGGSQTTVIGDWIQHRDRYGNVSSGYIFDAVPTRQYERHVADLERLAEPIIRPAPREEHPLVRKQFGLGDTSERRLGGWFEPATPLGGCSR